METLDIGSSLLPPQELKEMLESHKEQNEGWVEKMRAENDQERRALAEERVRW